MEQNLTIIDQRAFHFPHNRSNSTENCQGNPSQIAALLQIGSKPSDWLRLHPDKFQPLILQNISSSVESKSEILFKSEGKHWVGLDRSQSACRLNNMKMWILRYIFSKYTNAKTEKYKTSEWWRLQPNSSSVFSIWLNFSGSVGSANSCAKFLHLDWNSQSTSQSMRMGKFWRKNAFSKSKFQEFLEAIYLMILGARTFRCWAPEILTYIRKSGA